MRLFIIIAIIALLTGLWQLANNARRSASMRDNIVTADQAGSDQTAEIQKLTTYVHSHMHAGAKFELVGSYQRAADQAAAAQPSGQIYSQAQAACASKADSVTQARCVTDYVSKHLQPAATPAPAPDPAKYTYDLHSPLWAPDAAGLSLLVAAVAAVIAAFAAFSKPKAYF